MVLNVEIPYKPRYKQSELERMDLHDLLLEEWPFKLFVGDDLFFEDKYFPILEFIRYAFVWIENPHKDFIYNTMESDEGPILAFCLEGSSWKLYSVWQRFNCTQMYSFDDVMKLILQIINQIVILDNKT